MRIGVDLGGTKTEILCLDAAGAPLLRRRVPSPQGDYRATIDTIRELVEEVERAIGAHGSVGVGIPGAVSARTGLVKNANSTWLIGRPLAADLEAALGRLVRVENDANCFAVSEAVDGAGAGFATVFGVILGTGVGGGLVVDRRPLRGANAIAGEWGHNPLPRPEDDERPGPHCYCGRDGCIESFLSGPALARDWRGVGRDATGLADALAAREPAAVAAFDRYADRLARALGGVVNLFDPHAIVLGGGVSNLPGLCDAVRARWARHVFSDTVDTELRVAVHGDSSGVRGAAWLWPAQMPGANPSAEG